MRSSMEICMSRKTYLKAPTTLELAYWIRGAADRPCVSRLRVEIPTAGTAKGRFVSMHSRAGNDLVLNGGDKNDSEDPHEAGWRVFADGYGCEGNCQFLYAHPRRKRSHRSRTTGLRSTKLWSRAYGPLSLAATSGGSGGCLRSVERGPRGAFRTSEESFQIGAKAISVFGADAG